jgi:uncharacterized protein (TIGR02147 family)
LPIDADSNRSSDSQYKQLDIDSFKVIAEWQHIGLLSLIEIEGSKSDLNWIASRLGINRFQARSAMDRLMGLGLIRKSGRRLVVGDKPLSVQTLGLEPAMRQYLTHMLELAKQSLLVVSPQEREITTMTMAIDPDRMDEAREVIKRFTRELSALLETGTKKRVYTCAVQLFPIDQKEGAV